MEDIAENELLAHLESLKILVINVTQQDIDDAKGSECSAMKCPLAIAATRAVNYEGLFCLTDGVDLTVELGGFGDDSGTPLCIYDLTGEAGMFVAHFDDHYKLEPCQFELTMTKGPFINEY